jgi:hypothetical protein
MLAVEFADFGFGTVVGAIVAGSIAILLDQRRRKDAKDSRFLDEKRRAYKAVMQLSNVLVDDMLLLATFLPIADRLPEGEAFAAADLEHGKALVTRVESNLAKYNADLMDAVTEVTLLDPKSTGEAARMMLMVLKSMGRHLADRNVEKVVGLEGEYRRAWFEFRDAARRDLGTDA